MIKTNFRKDQQNKKKNVGVLMKNGNKYCNVCTSKMELQEPVKITNSN